MATSAARAGSKAGVRRGFEGGVEAGQAQVLGEVGVPGVLDGLVHGDGGADGGGVDLGSGQGRGFGGVVNSLAAEGNPPAVGVEGRAVDGEGNASAGPAVSALAPAVGEGQEAELVEGDGVVGDGVAALPGWSEGDGDACGSAVMGVVGSVGDGVELLEEESAAVGRERESVVEDWHGCVFRCLALCWPGGPDSRRRPINYDMIKCFIYLAQSSLAGGPAKLK
jgi:hypothetical protein